MPKIKVSPEEIQRKQEEIQKKQEEIQKKQKDIGEIIREIRKDRGYSQEVLGKMVGYAKANISKLERGEVSITLEALIKIAAALGVDLSNIIKFGISEK